MQNDLQRESSKWRIHLTVFLILAVPAFTGFPLEQVPAQIVPGIRWSWMAYGVLVNLVIDLLLSPRIYARILTIAALVTLPVVYAGAILTWTGLQLGFSAGTEYAAGRHYTQLCITMLSVVPLALALVVAIPFGAIERRMLLQTGGVTPRQKKRLMALRVFNHIVFSVAPAMVEILREEGFAHRWRMGLTPSRPNGIGGRWHLVKTMMHDLVHLAVEGICAALQFIPLWAHEIAQLHERTPRRQRHLKD